MNTRIDISINESGSEVVTRAIDRLADTLQQLDPKAAMSLRGQALRVGINTDKMVREVAGAVLDTVVHATPHDTGQARAGWITTISDQPPNVRSEVGKLDYDGDATVDAGKAYLATTKRAPGQSVFITNTHDYIQALNEGWSKQAAAGFVEAAVQVGNHVASKADLVK